MLAGDGLIKLATLGPETGHPVGARYVRLRYTVVSDAKSTMVVDACLVPGIVL